MAFQITDTNSDYPKLCLVPPALPIDSNVLIISSIFIKHCESLRLSSSTICAGVICKSGNVMFIVSFDDILVSFRNSEKSSPLLPVFVTMGSISRAVSAAVSGK